VQAYGSLQAELAQLQDRKNKLLEQVSLIRGKMESKKGGSGDKATLEIDLHKLQARKTELETQLATAEQETSSIQSRVTESAELLRNVNTELDALYELLNKPEQVDSGRVTESLNQLDQLIEQFAQKFADAETIAYILQLPHIPSYATSSLLST
jgi:chromosome segregation ATPase